MTTPYVSNLPDLRKIISQWREKGESIAVVPTMGALHAGHLSLVSHANSLCDRTIATIFVNPAQFAPDEDFGAYPRTFDTDLAKLHAHACDLVWAPNPEAMYPGNFATYITPQGAANSLETEFRKDFFRGVATVCCKLFLQTQADVAVFGEKDYQQLCVIKQMVRDLNLPIRIDGRPTIRETDGLAMSSRNAYLSNSDRAIAVSLYRGLEALARAVRDGKDIAQCEAQETQNLLQSGFRTVDYLTVRDATTLQPPATDMPANRLRVLGAAWLGKTRLIDNIACG